MLNILKCYRLRFVGFFFFIKEKLFIIHERKTTISYLKCNLKKLIKIQHTFKKKIKIIPIYANGVFNGKLK